MGRFPTVLMLLVGLAADLVASAPGWANPGDEPTALSAGYRAERTIGGKAVHTYTADLALGAAIVANVEQEGIDVAIDAYDPDGKKLTTFDSPNGSNGPEPIRVTALKPGVYRFDVKALDDTAAPGRYLVTVGALLKPEENALAIAKEEFAPAHAAILKLWQDARRDPHAVETFIQSRKGMGPFVESIPGDDEDMRITFVFPGDDDTRDVIVNGGPDAGGGLPMARIPSTNMFFASTNLPKTARFSYSFNVHETHYVGSDHSFFVPESKTVPDPLCKGMVSGQSYVEMPDAPGAFAYSLPTRGTPRGRFGSATITSKILGESRMLHIYTPAGYDGKTPCNLLIEFDGETQGDDSSLVPVETILDNLIATGKIGPTVGVMVNTNPTRDRDLTCYKPYADFIAQELLPWVRSHYAIKAGPEGVVISGSSFGGLSATYCAFVHPEAFGNVLSMSGSYWVGPNWRNRGNSPDSPITGQMIDEFKKSGRLPIRFYLEIGLFEPGASMLGSNREMRDVLGLKGYDLTYDEFAGGHQPIHWRAALPEGLITLLGKH